MADLPPPPPIDPNAPMISRTERIVVDRPVRAFWDWSVAAPLESIITGVGGLPGVVGTTPLTPGAWGTAGERRIVNLADGSSCTEQILAATPPDGFRYQVWDYSTAAARPVAYALGEFRHLPLEGGRTEVVWTYAFRLRGDRFPGFLGPLGRMLMKAAFLDRAYAALMRETLKAMKAGAESSLS